MAGTGGLNPGNLVGGAIDEVEAGLTAVAQPALILGATVVAIGFGWRMAKRFVKG